jgi:hypothetical protein
VDDADGDGGFIGDGANLADADQADAAGGVTVGQRLGGPWDDGSSSRALITGRGD